MKVGSAKIELEQYIESRVFDCPGKQWGFVERHYATLDAANSGKATGRTWTPARYADRPIRRSLQYCIPGADNTFPTAQAYAAQINWTKHIRRMLVQEPTWRNVPAPPKYDPKPHYVGLPAEHGLGVKFVAAFRATGPGWERDVLKEWPRALRFALTAARLR